MEAKLPSIVLERLARWTQDPTAFSKAVLPYARIKRHSNAYQEGDVGSDDSIGLGREREGTAAINPTTAFNIAWHKRISGRRLPPPDTRDARRLTRMHVATILLHILSAAKGDTNFTAQRERYQTLDKLTAAAETE